ncbi:conjugal transfer protein [Saccharolobus shibatae]|uniref:Uncharacterized protein n=1 Tax=Saccharolobus shibatae TaxID=2286 RepID=A0A8F5BV48_9CREN|nr:conjugal transfer protein [Saccharolobus shibatae]QXJ32044.1 hypothetical protein J5U21_01695 [Saccharolobus shibatae]
MEESEKYLLALLKASWEDEAKLTLNEIQFIMFLLEKELGVELNLDFTPSIFGPHSLNLKETLKRLVSQGIVEVIKSVSLSTFDIYVLRNNVEVEIEDNVMNFFRYWIRKDYYEIFKYILVSYGSYFDTPMTRR